MSEDNKPRSPKWVKVVLVISLAMNLAVAGLVLGTFARGDGLRDRVEHSIALRSLGLGPFSRALSPEDRDELRGRVTRDGVELREERRAVGRELRRIEQALRADPFDRAGVEAALARSRNLVVSLQEIGHTALLDQIETMSFEDRIALADSLEEVTRRHRRP